VSVLVSWVTPPPVSSPLQRPGISVFYQYLALTVVVADEAYNVANRIAYLQWVSNEFSGEINRNNNALPLDPSVAHIGLSYKFYQPTT